MFLYVSENYLAVKIYNSYYGFQRTRQKIRLSVEAKAHNSAHFDLTFSINNANNTVHVHNRVHRNITFQKWLGLCEDMNLKSNMGVQRTKKNGLSFMWKKKK